MTLNQLLGCVEDKIGKAYVEALSACISFTVIFGVALYYMANAVNAEIEKLNGLDQRKRYANLLFLKLLSDTRKYQREIGSFSSLARLDYICEEFRKQVAKFKGSADKVINPTIEEFLMDPNEYFYVEDVDLAKFKDITPLTDESFHNLLKSM